MKRHIGLLMKIMLFSTILFSCKNDDFSFNGINLRNTTCQKVYEELSKQGFEDGTNYTFTPCSDDAAYCMNGVAEYLGKCDVMIMPEDDDFSKLGCLSFIISTNLFPSDSEKQEIDEKIEIIIKRFGDNYKYLEDESGFLKGERAWVWNKRGGKIVYRIILDESMNLFHMAFLNFYTDKSFKGTLCDVDGNKSKTKKEKNQETYTRNTINGHEYVDLGLSVKWATCNVGATQPHGYGNYYAWGETSTKSDYTEDNSRTYGKNMSDISGNVAYDAARANWGGSWRMPTEREMEELENKCTWKWTTQSGVNGYKVTGPNGNSIFLPAAGDCRGSSRHDVGEDGYYWSSTPGEHRTGTGYACSLNFNSNFNSGYHDVVWVNRRSGYTVRPVSE